MWTSASVFSHALQANTTSEAALLYSHANTQFSELTAFEQLWAAWYLWIGNPTIATGLMSFIMHEVSDGLCDEFE
jgi:methylsterol monooxygenase